MSLSFLRSQLCLYLARPSLNVLTTLQIAEPQRHVCLYAPNDV